jgi:hypothetical protein
METSGHADEYLKLPAHTKNTSAPEWCEGALPLFHFASGKSPS